MICTLKEKTKISKWSKHKRRNAPDLQSADYKNQCAEKGIVFYNKHL